MQLTLDERRDFALNIRLLLAEWETVIVAYEPGDMTHYEFTLTKLATVPFVGRTYSDDGRMHRNTPGDRWLMADPYGKCSMTVDLSPGHYTDPDYFAEKWNGHLHTAVVLCELLNMITRCDEHIVDAMRAQHSYVFPEVTT